MKPCTHCGTTILFGGVEGKGQRFCNENCHAAGMLALRSQSIPPEVVAQAMEAVVDGPCPVCGGPGPVDVFTSYRVYSAIAVTSWRSLPRISCRGCATKAQLGSTLFSFLLGWWGIPWGLIMTPIQIVRNLAGLSREADRARPSKVLETLVRMRLASEATTPAYSSRAA